MKTTANLMKAEVVLDQLVAMGCMCRIDATGRFVRFDPAPRIKKADFTKFCRLIREATNLEHATCLVPDIDRMGKVVGWHVSKNK